MSCEQSFQNMMTQLVGKMVGVLEQRDNKNTMMFYDLNQQLSQLCAALQGLCEASTQLNEK